MLMERFPDRQVWQRMPQEPTLWYTRFSKYFLPMGPSRSLFPCYQRWRSEESDKGPLSPGNIKAPDGWTQTASRWRWRERAAEYDAYLLDKQRTQDETEVAAMLSRQRTTGRKMQELAVRRLIEIEANLSLLNATEARKYLTEGAHLEREARGLPGTVVQTNVGLVATPQVSLADFDWRSAVGLPPDDPILTDNTEE